ncbi:MAG: hypothetical protein II338_01415 [Bacteroidaceae bacterium]|nr:hypothetical protein [Bacteroidaceae bacterium]MBR5530232.1 hypothetical protein [Bacteroidaceae bacterium]
MNSKFFLTAALAATVALSSCNKLGELSADNFTVTPSPLEAVAGQVPVTINGRFPEKYMKKKAIVTVTPVLRYAGGEAVGQSATFQGEKVQGNNQEIAYKVGGNYTMRNTFAYIPEMQQSELFLTFTAQVGKRQVEVPEVKIADGVVATSALLGKTLSGANTAVAPDAYQYIIAQTKSAQIRYLIQQAKVRTSELKTTSVQDFIRTLREIKEDQKGLQMGDIEISAYASPDGATDLNSRLAAARERSSATYVRGQLKEIGLNADINTRYTAEDWEGFQELVAASNIQDKDAILRVLSMYPDPEEREAQIRNLSVAFSELADEILPELRRARLTIHYNIVGRTDAEIQSQYKNDPTQLSLEELLYAATLTSTGKEDIYATAIKQYPNDFRAYNNMAALAYADSDLEAAKAYLDKAASLNANAPEVFANKALVAMAEGKIDEAETLLARATTAPNYSELLGNLQVAKGNYAQAVSALNGKASNSTVLAQILNKDYAGAATTLAGLSSENATTNYLKAIVAARTNKAAEALSHLGTAIKLDPSYKERAAKDLEFLSLFNNSAFLELIK